jgi:methylenetetrahydrofolate dehydrogenase (NADP+)/methenyltetrahydrofolate cyclohydrolase
MILIEGKKVAEKRREKIIAKLKGLNGTPSLVVIRVGNDPASEIYIHLKRKMCEEIGVNFTEYHLEKDVTQEELLNLISKLNDDDSVNAILLQIPIPYHLDIMQAFEAINPDKDARIFDYADYGIIANIEEII